MSSGVVVSAQVDASLRISTQRLASFGNMQVTIGATSATALVHAFFTLATEAHDDDGLPHTLEHLIFLGSDAFPYKGLLDSLSNRSFANGTNAWTATDSTVYTLSTAGARGALQMLPVFLDHVLFPTLSDAGFVAEVHHVDGDGQDAGVVYAEMQGRENDAQSLAFNALLHAVYGPPERCGFSAETGGKLANLRALTNRKVRDYHRQFYTPANLNIVIVGAVDFPEVLAALEPMRDKVARRAAEIAAPLRPWLAPVPPFVPTSPADNRSLVQIQFPDDDESVGLAVFGMRGPRYGEFNRRAAIDALLLYLTDSSVSPLRAALVDCDDALCSSVDYAFEEASETMLHIQLEDVPTERLATSCAEFRAALAAVTSIDVQRMRDLLRRTRLEQLDELEQQPEHFVTDVIVPHFLYGAIGGDGGEQQAQLAAACGVLARLDALAAHDEAFWLGVLRTELLAPPYVWLEARASAELSETMQDEEADRIDEQCEALGDDGLDAKAAELEAAGAALAVPIPDALLAAMPVPDVADVRRVSFAVAQSGNGGGALVGGAADAPLAQWLARGDARARLAALPVATQIGHAATGFCVLEAFVDTSALSWAQRRALEVLLDAQFELDMRASGASPALTHEQVVEGLSRDLVSHSNSLGYAAANFSVGMFGALLKIELKASAANWARACEWLAAVLFRGVWSAERVSIAANKLDKSVSNASRSGGLVTRTALGRRLFKGRERSNHAACWLGEQKAYLKELLERLASPDSADAVVREFAALSALLADALVLVNAACDVTQLGDLLTPLEQMFAHAPPRAAGAASPALSAAPLSRALLPGDWSAVRGTTILSLASIESSFMLQATPVSLAFDSDDVPALWVLCQLLDAMEGPFWKGIRGAGFSYGFNIDFSCETGLIVFSLTKATSLAKGLRAAKAIVDEFASGERQFDQLSIDGARSTVTFRLLEAEATPLAAVASAFVERLQGTVGLQERQLRAVERVDAAALKRVLNAHVVPLFDEARVVRVASTNAAKCEELAKELEADGATGVTVCTVEEL
jgi:Zn-dependent M16 (insulinase) family peptidase